jgi:ADP-heptose:LPS heptosyltransferase
MVLHKVQPSAPPQKGPGTRPQFGSLLIRHAQVFWYALTVILPVILKTRSRPVIFSRYTGMGDIICTIPAARELMRRHADRTFIYNCHPDFVEIPRLSGVASKVTSLESIGLLGHWYSFLFAGYYHFTHGDDTPGQVAREPMVAEFFRQFDLPVTDAHPTMAVPAAAQKKVDILLAEKKLDASRLVLIHPGPSWTVKEWPREHWTKLVAGLRERGHTNIAQLGVARYMNFGEVMVTPIAGTVSLIDALSIEDCFAVIRQAKLFIGIDSGLLHIAACTRTPANSLWGPTSPEFFYGKTIHPDFVVSNIACQGCHHRLPRLHWITGCPYDVRCMKDLRVDQVLSACLALLEKDP